MKINMKRELELYLHIPFCVRKCNYCDFLSASGTKEELNTYVQALCKEINHYKDFAKEYIVKTVFLGGGTPSLLTADQMKLIFENLNQIFTIDPIAEITMEMNPGTVNIEKLRSYKQAGINRVSIGLQSTENKELKMLGRIHTYEDFLNTWEAVEQVGFKNRNIDLMSALPGQTIKSWENTLRKILELNPEHISAYSLILEEETKFYEWYNKGRFDAGEWKLPSEDDEYTMGEMTIQMLESCGMHRYEISNYAYPGKECRHNLGYWDRVEYLGIGAGAASLISIQSKNTSEIQEQIRFNHVKNRNKYIQNINQKQAIEIEQENLTLENQMEEFMYLGLRKTAGISKNKFLKFFGRDIGEVYGSIIKRLEEDQLIISKEDNLMLTHRGMDISNYVLSEFLLT